MSEAQKGHKGYWLGKSKPISQETKDKISETLRGHSVLEETKNKISETSKGRTAWNKGKAWPDEIKTRISETNKRKGIEPKTKDTFPCGEKHPNWNGGSSFEPYSISWKETLKTDIRERDQYICQVCGRHQKELNYKLHCHHIDYDKNNCEATNLMTLCRNCHAKTNGNREFWKKYFA